MGNDGEKNAIEEKKEKEEKNNGYFQHLERYLSDIGTEIQMPKWKMKWTVRATRLT